MKYKAVVFDLDGTLLDTLGDISGAVSYALSRFSFPSVSREGVRARIGDGARKLIERCLPADASEETVSGVLALFRDYYRENPIVTTRPYEGIADALGALGRLGIPLAVASNKDDFAVKHIINTFFPNVFVAACGVTEAHRRKPCADIPSAALAGIDAAPDEVLFVGDSLTDRQTAENCGFDFLYVLWGYGYAEKVLPANTAKKAEDIVKFILRGS